MISSMPNEPSVGGPGLLDIPNEIILDNLLPALDAKDIAAVSRTNKQLHILAEDETLWLRLTLQHYSYHPSLLAPPSSRSGWSKRVYLGLRSPEATVWGSTDNGRLGVDEATIDRGVRRHRRHVDHPVTVTFSPSTLPSRSGLVPPATAQHLADRKGDELRPQIVDLQAGGYGFTARDAEGGVWVWGQLDGSVIGFNQPLSSPHSQCARPTRLALPCRAESICTGRKHVLVLDSDNLIWEMRSWGLAYHHTAPALTAPTNSGSAASSRHIRQISAGWSHSACLTSKGEIYVWYPFTEVYGSSLTPETELSNSTSSSEGNNDLQRWGKVGDVVVLQTSIPTRPTRPLSDFENPSKGQEAQNARLKKLEEAWLAWEDKASPSDKKQSETVVKIASGADFIVALKANGEVWMHRLRGGQGEIWIFLPHLSGPGTTHLTAQYLSITSYSPTSIHHVRIPDDMLFHPDELVPVPVPALEGRRIIQIASGDYHEVALTEGGEVWTWGQGDHGQLGTGKTVRMVDEPQRVIFSGEEDGGKRRFAFGVTAAGWHTGALLLGDDSINTGQATVNSVIAREEKASENTEAGGPPDPWGEPRPGGPTPGVPGPHATRAPIMGLGALGHPVFRVGYAGRGSAIGNVARRNWQRRQQAEEGQAGEERGSSSAGETGEHTGDVAHGGTDETGNNGRT